MNINRNNYEEFFLLYADNELTAAERAEVGLFLSENPDLEGDLRMFCETVLIPEPGVVMENKFTLYRNEKDFINTHNCEEIFVLYHDNELNIYEQAETEKFLVDYPATQKLFSELQECRLKPEVLLYGNKTSLYRKEKRAKIVPLIWWRAAAAVVIISLSIYGGLSYFNRQPANDLANKTTIQQKNNKIVPINIDKVKSADEIIATNENDAKVKEEVNQVFEQTTKDKIEKTLLVKKNKQVLPEALQIKNDQVDKKDFATNQLPAVSNQVNTLLITGNEPQVNNFGLATKQILQLPEIANENINNIRAYNEDEQSNKDNYVFYNVSEEKFKKSKVGIFLRKAKRVVTRNTFLGGSRGKIASVDLVPGK